jgi:hypothetical protein
MFRMDAKFFPDFQCGSGRERVEFMFIPKYTSDLLMKLYRRCRGIRSWEGLAFASAVSAGDLGGHI